jgi:hypothetical protein
MRLMAMCEKCAELDKSILHLRRMIEQLGDHQTLAAANTLIKEMEAEKATLHPEYGCPRLKPQGLC